MTGTPDILFFKRTSAVSSTEKSDRTVIGSLAIMSLILILVIRYSSSWISKVVASGADALFKSPSVTTPTRRYLFMTGSMLILFSLISLIASCIESFMSIVMGGALIQFFTSMVIFLFLTSPSRSQLLRRNMNRCLFVPYNKDNISLLYIRQYYL